MEQIRNKNNVKKLIFKAMLYIAFLWWGYILLLMLSYIFSDYLDLILQFMSKIEVVADFFSGLDIIDFNDKDDTGELIFIISYTPFVFSPFICYILAKPFGMFKFIDSLKTGIKLKTIIIFLISVFSFLVLFCKYSYIDNLEDLCLPFAISVFGLIPAFFLYKFFQYLTKKYPKPFKQIGYYCSIEFWKKTVLKLYKKINGIN